MTHQPCRVLNQYANFPHLETEASLCFPSKGDRVNAQLPYQKKIFNNSPMLCLPMIQRACLHYHSRTLNVIKIPFPITSASQPRRSI